METLEQRGREGRGDRSSSFDSFFGGWLARQEGFLQQLVAARALSQPENRTDELADLISRVLQHYQSYYDEKSRLARDDVLLVFSPTWLTPFERSLLWIAGWKPSMAFRLVTSSVGDMLCSEQMQKMERLRAETRAEERELSEEMAKLQETVASAHVLELARGVGRERGGERMEVESVVEALQVSLEVILEGADLLRLKTVRKVVDILSPIQTVGFLAEAAQLQLRIRRWALQKDASRTRIHQRDGETPSVN